jgi:hypothetical protein
MLLSFGYTGDRLSSSGANRSENRRSGRQCGGSSVRASRLVLVVCLPLHARRFSRSLQAALLPSDALRISADCSFASFLRVFRDLKNNYLGLVGKNV